MTDTIFQLLDSSLVPDISPNDLIMSRNIAEALHAHYPGQRWAITCEGATGLITIRNLWLSGTYGYVLKIGDISSISALIHKAVIGAGELMERFNMKRGQFNEADYMTMPTNFAGALEFSK